MLRKAAWAGMVLMAGLISTYALVSAFVTGMRTPFVEALFADRTLRAYGHLAGGGVALTAGAIQFSTRLRWNRPGVHRLLGKVYLVLVAVGGFSALGLAPFSGGGIVAHFGFGMLAVLWLSSSAVAYVRVRAGDYESHREWMIRSYALCLAAVTLRIYLPLSAMAGTPFEDAYPAISWLCWVPNLVVAEWLVLRSSLAPLDPASG